MATDTVLTKRIMLEAFHQMATPTGFLTSFFRTPPQNITSKKKVIIDIKRNLEQYAVDVIRGTGGHLNNNKRFSTKEYEPPMYDEYSAFTEDELLERIPGQTEYSEMSNAAQMAAVMAMDQVELRNLILRAIEKQASDVLFTGTVVLINNDTIDFKQKATHQIAAPVAWSTATADALADIEGAAILNRQDGKANSSICIFGKTAWNEFLKLNDTVAKFNLRRANLADVKPPRLNDQGAAFHGLFTAGSYEFQAWTYPQFKQIPEGLPNAGDIVPYVPDDKVLVIPTPSEIRLDLVYAGVPAIVDRVDPRLRILGFDRAVTRIRADFHPYAHIDDKAVAMEIGVRSAPLCIPTQIDGYAVLTT